MSLMLILFAVLFATANVVVVVPPAKPNVLLILVDSRHSR